MRKIKLATEKMTRQDVNHYFLCDYDYTASGFMASTAEINPTEEYEVMIQWPNHHSGDGNVAEDFMA